MPSKGRDGRRKPQSGATPPEDARRDAAVAASSLHARAGRAADDDDAAAFAQAVRGARQLGGAPLVSPLIATPNFKPPARRSLPVPAGVSPLTTTAASGAGAGDSWTFRADGVDRGVLRKLRAGEVPVDGQLDLHGLTRARAVAALDRFVEAARAGGRRCLLIIHGRGLHSGEAGPALRDAVRAALTGGKQAAAVLACCPAPPARGGAGATLVLLRR